MSTPTVKQIAFCVFKGRVLIFIAFGQPILHTMFSINKIIVRYESHYIKYKNNLYRRLVNLRKTTNKNILYGTSFATCKQEESLG